MRWRKQKREPRDPSWIFSTWPIPNWTGTTCELTVTAIDGPARLQTIADYIYPGPQEQTRLKQLMERMGSVGGAVRMLEGTFVLTEPLSLEGQVGSFIYGNRFVMTD